MEPIATTNNMNGQQSRFPAGNHADFMPAGNQYQSPMNINMHDSMFQSPDNLGYNWALQNALRTRGSDFGGWVGGQPMANVPINFSNPCQWSRPISSNSGNGMHGMHPMYPIEVPEPSPLAVVPESTLIPLSMSPVSLPEEAEPSIEKPKPKPTKNRWTPEEHKLFLIGLKKYTKGDWKSISRKLVVTRSPTQVASHAQKYKKREIAASDEATASNGSTRKKRSSIHDIMVKDIPDDVGPDEIQSLQDIINAQH